MILIELISPIFPRTYAMQWFIIIIRQWYIARKRNWSWCWWNTGTENILIQEYGMVEQMLFHLFVVLIYNKEIIKHNRSWHYENIGLKRILPAERKNYICGRWSKTNKSLWFIEKNPFTNRNETVQRILTWKTETRSIKTIIWSFHESFQTKNQPRIILLFVKVFQIG